MKKLSSLVLLLFMAVTTAFAQEVQGMGPIPFNAEVRWGVLDNGLTYYVFKNQYPEKRASFYIAQRVGSIQEDEDQRGLAHFLEHMAFNGSENFKSSDAIVEYCRSIGCSFGGELNAYTSTDETVYNICNVPTERPQVVDSVLLILKDWANGLTLDGAEIDNERGVIHEEWRLRTAPTMRMLERNLEKLYPGSKYGRRMPIGTMEVVDNFSHEALRNYYHKWYRPDNQAIIIVGDFDIPTMEGKVQKLFSSIPKPAPGAAQVVDEPVPDNEEMIVVVDKDKEQTMNLVLMFFKQDPLPRALRSDMVSELMNVMNSCVTSIINERLAEVAKNADCPFLQAGVDYENYLLAKTKQGLSLQVVPKEGKDVEAVQAAYREVLRACKTGFNASEYQRAKDNIISAMEAKLLNKSKIHNNEHAQGLYRHYLDGTAFPTIANETDLDKQICSMLPVEALNEYAAQLIEANGRNVVLLSLNRDAEGVVMPTEDALKQAVLAVNGEQFEAYVDNAKNEPLVPELPKAGSIVSTKKDEKYGTTELMLSNGARVVMKKTDYKADQILMEASSVGGNGLYGAADYTNLKVINDVIEASGLGNFDNTELTKALAGKKVGIGFSLGGQHETLNGQSTPKDLETLFQLTYLYFTNIKKDQKSFDNLMAQTETALKNIAINPDAAFSDSVTCTLYDHNPRQQRITVDELHKVNYDRCLQIAKERLANAGDFTFYFVGNYDEDQLKQYICQYIAALPGTTAKETPKPTSTYHQGSIDNTFRRKMETPKANAYIFWYNNEEPYSVKNAYLAEAAGEVLSMIYLKEIREKESAAYSAGAQGSCAPSLDKPFTVLIGVCPFKPEKADRALQIMDEEMQKMAKTVDADMLTKVKENMLKVYDENLKKNSYWLSMITLHDEYSVDPLAETLPAINNLTPTTVADFVKNTILKSGNKVKVVMLPEE